MQMINLETKSVKRSILPAILQIKFFSCKSDSTIANVRLSVCLSTIEPINPQAYQPSSLLTIQPNNHPAYQPSSLSTIQPIDHQAY